MRVNVDKVDGAGTSGGEDAKVVALGNKELKVPRVFVRVVAAGDVRLDTESGFQRRRLETGSRFPMRLDHARIFADPKLPNCQSPSSSKSQPGCLSDGTRETRSYAVPQFMADTSVKCGCFSVEAQVVIVQSEALL